MVLFVPILGRQKADAGDHWSRNLMLSDPASKLQNSLKSLPPNNLQPNSHQLISSSLQINLDSGSSVFDIKIAYFIEWKLCSIELSLEFYTKKLFW